MNEIATLSNQYLDYNDIISFDEKNPTLRSPYATTDLPFYQTKESLMDIDTFRNFLRNAEINFRSRKEYKAYKSYLIEYIGINKCQVFGNITTEDADIECIIGNLLEIAHILSLQMFEYGVLSTKQIKP